SHAAMRRDIAATVVPKTYGSDIGHVRIRVPGGSRIHGCHAWGSTTYSSAPKCRSSTIGRCRPPRRRLNGHREPGGDRALASRDHGRAAPMANGAALPAESAPVKG